MKLAIAIGMLVFSGGVLWKGFTVFFSVFAGKKCDFCGDQFRLNGEELAFVGESMGGQPQRHCSHCRQYWLDRGGNPFASLSQKRD